MRRVITDNNRLEHQPARFYLVSPPNSPARVPKGCDLAHIFKHSRNILEKATA
ncbi:hypothetical protein HMPREF0758_4305 [Serratia odorifera DSM 4582]|uniref:Uncharacterized protein n=1 Tax=Serratia odorifera DSM 4582 TaxID=667129 RepID=D4E805_SEROD|nr:hypothetical protein HMPREF0758_4305 [Serratia odorifera DSM 4582]